MSKKNQAELQFKDREKLIKLNMGFSINKERFFLILEKW